MKASVNGEVYKPRPRKQQDELMDFLVDENITDRSRFVMNPRYWEFVGIHALNAHLANVLPAVSAQQLNQKIDFVEDTRLPDSSLIYKYLDLVQHWSHQAIILFAQTMRKIATQENGKVNTLWAFGVSNAGKSKLSNGFINAYFEGSIGYPDNSPRTGFKWGSCCKKRVILWDEPYFTIEDGETLKLLFGGEPCNVQVKYMADTFIYPTPVFVTANKLIHDT